MDNTEDLHDSQFEEPTKEDEELLAWVTDHTDRWRDNRDANYVDLWDEYMRIFRGQWEASDKTRESERSRIISPATQQAVETRHAEIMEAIFGQGEFFDIEDDIKDINGTSLDVEMLRVQLHEDFKRDKIRKAIDQIVLMGEIFGTGIGEITVTSEKRAKPATQSVAGVSGTALIGVEESNRVAVKIKPVNPKNFLIDPNADSIEDALGVAVEKFVSIHKIVEGIENGIYRKVDITSASEEDALEPTDEIRQFQDNKVKLLTYYGLVPREYLFKEEGEEDDYVELFDEDSEADEHCDLVEAIVVIANDSILLKAEENPYMMKDRPVVAFQSDTLPGRFWGRGTVEKGYNSQKALDGQLRAHMDSLALTTSPMLAMDATRLPRGAKFEIRPGKAILTNGNPSEIMMPFKFGETDGSAAQTAREFERMLLQATGTVDSAGLPSSAPRDAGAGGMSMAMAGIIKKYKRTLTNFQEDFLIPFINKAAFRYMQFDTERYPSVDMVFIPTATLGILAREFEQQQMIGLLQTLGPNTPVLPLILKGILQNSSLSNRGELMEALEKMSTPDPKAQEAAAQEAAQAKQAQMALLQAQVEEIQAKTQKTYAEAQQTTVETQLEPQVVQAKLAAALSNNLHEGAADDAEFARRAKMAELMLKEEDIKSNERIATLQMNNKKETASRVNAALGD